MIVSRKNICNYTNLMFNNMLFERVKTVKYLDVKSMKIGIGERQKTICSVN